jgi:hypothetical protein
MLARGEIPKAVVGKIHLFLVHTPRQSSPEILTYPPRGNQ